MFASRGARRLAFAVGCAAALIVAAPAAAAAGPWSATSDVGPAGYMPAGLSFTAGGRGMLTLAPTDVRARPLAAGTSMGDRFGVPFTLTRADDAFRLENLGREVAVFGRDGVVATGLRGGSGAEQPWVAFGRIGHLLGRRQPLAIPGWNGGSVELAADARGDVALIAIGCAGVGCRKNPLYLFYRSHGGRFGRPIRVARAAYDRGDFATGVAPAVAVNQAGDVLLAWGCPQTGGTPLCVRIRRAGRWRGPAQRIGALLDTGTITARLTDGDRAAVAWWTQRADTGGAGQGPLEPPVYEVATAGTGGRFGPVTRLDAGVTGIDPALSSQGIRPQPSIPNLFAVIASSGRVRLAWTGADADGPLVRSATVIGGAPADAQMLGHGTLAALAADGHDRAVALWAKADVVLASTAPPGRPYGAEPESIASGQTVARGVGDAAFDPRTHRVVATWETGTRSDPGYVTAPYQARYATRVP